MNRIARKRFLKTLGIVGIGYGAVKLWDKISEQDKTPLDKILVREFVSAGHGNLPKVQEMFAEHPVLLNAAHDWKDGDFETCLGAALHVGHKALAQFLIDHGAQTNVFAAVVFGRIEIVRPMLEAFPTTLHAKGPHGLGLLHHAEMGGEEALEVKEYLLSLGAKK